MSKFTFICEDEPMLYEGIITKKTFEFNADTLDGVIGEFESFLRGCGFYFDGYLEMVEPNQKVAEDEDDLDLYTESLFGKK